MKVHKLVCALSSDIYLSFLNLNFCTGKNSFAKIMNGLLCLKLFLLSNGGFIFFRGVPTATTNSVFSA